jgi:hypothetical protein
LWTRGRNGGGSGVKEERFEISIGRCIKEK